MSPIEKIPLLIEINSVAGRFPLVFKCSFEYWIIAVSDQGHRFKNRIYDELARVGKALASGPRLELIDLLCQGSRTVEELARQAGQTVANTSHHLQVLNHSRLVEREKQGVHVTYRLSDEQVCTLYRDLRHLAQARLDEIDAITRQFLLSRDAMETVDQETLVARVRSGEVTVLDVRPAEEYRAGHLPGALSVPLAELEARLIELPMDRKVVAYCRGPYCVLAIEAVATLRRHGFDAERLEEGVPDWRSRGGEIAIVP